MAPFEKGRTKTGGRAKGARNKLSAAFLEALAADFAEHGEGVIKIVRTEHPEKYLSAVVQLMPKEFEITENRLAEISDDDLAAYIRCLEQQLATRDADGGTRPAIN